MAKPALHFITLCSALLVFLIPSICSASSFFSENFESYTVGDFYSQTSDWTTTRAGRIYINNTISSDKIIYHDNTRNNEYINYVKDLDSPEKLTLLDSGYFEYTLYPFSTTTTDDVDLSSLLTFASGTFIMRLQSKDSNYNKIRYYDETNTLQYYDITRFESHQIGVEYSCNPLDNTYDYNVTIDGNEIKMSDYYTDNCYNNTIMSVKLNFLHPGIGFDNFLWSYNKPTTSTDDPLQNFVGYVNDSDYSIHLMRPSIGSLPNENVVMSVNPDPDFSTIWAVRFPSDKIDKTFITVRQCLDDNFEIDDCSIIYPLESVEDLGADGSKSVISFQLDFPVILNETEYYLIQEWKELEDESVEVVATAPFILTGEVSDSNPYDLNYYNEEIDYGFFGNLLRDFFLPDSNFFVNNFNELNSLRQEKFSWYFTVKDEFSSGIEILESSSSEPPDITLSLYGSADIPIFNTTYINPYMSTIKLWISAFLWLLFGIFIIKQTSTILKS